MTPVPSPWGVRVLVEELLGRPADVVVGVPWTPSGADLGTIGVYVDDALRIRVVVLCDLQLSAALAAAIGLVPSARAAEAVRDMSLPEALQENLDEVLNVCAGLLNVARGPHLRLHRVFHVGGSVPREFESLGGVLGRRLDLTVAVSGYGQGRLSFVGLA